MQNSRFASAAVTAVILSVPLVCAADVVVFSDTFGAGSTLNQTPTGPTAFSADYEVASTKNATSMSINPGHLTFGLPSTSSGFVELQARFGAAPTTLGVGDYIRMTGTFVDTAGILMSGKANSSLVVGLYNSGGVDPLTGLQASGLSASSNYNRGGAQLWAGYDSRILQSGSAQTATRPQQNGGTVNDNNGNQDLLFNGAGTGTYKNPTGASLGSQTATVALTAGSTYTFDYMLTLTAANTLSIAYNLYDGAGTGGANLFSMTSTALDANVLTTTFDGLAIGYRFSGASGDPASSIDLNSITIMAGAVPEPTVAALALGGFGLMLLFRRASRR